MIVKKPALSTIRIWNMSLGFLGIQFGFALQTGNASRILQTFGAEVEHLPLFWLAAPITGMIIQPLIGYYSDRTWTWLGRRRPFFLFGAFLAALSLILMPNSSVFAVLLPPVLIGAGMLMLMDASFNIAMEPFRALIADNLPESQYSKGFSIQTFLISIGAILGSLFPYLLANYFGIAKTAPQGEIPDNVLYSFYAGAVLMLLTLLWTVVTTKEYTPQERAAFHPAEKNIPERKGVLSIFTDFGKMPHTMAQLGLVQFFSWFGLFAMWIYMTPAVVEHVYKLAPGDTVSVKYADAGNWVGILFGIYNTVAAVYALFLPAIARLTSKKVAHAISLVAGGVGLLSIYFIDDPRLLIISMIGVGLAWGSILAMPYAILSTAIPAKKMGVYMGIFNFFITLPQMVIGFFGGMLIKNMFHNQAIYALVLAGIFMLCGALSVIFIREKNKSEVAPEAAVIAPTQSL
ncbi:MFS transporter [Chitinophaga sp. MM2321]|uniref:MFS transporter n=1 Tax=Chitinophaga sp. MM2321 TaxID=3137178 RepID=UPI0032D58531